VNTYERRAARLFAPSIFGRTIARTASGKRTGEFETLSLKHIASKRTATGGPIVGAAAINAEARRLVSQRSLCDVDVDPETGHVKIVRYEQNVGVNRRSSPP
jgi:hypothetical protein